MANEQYLKPIKNAEVARELQAKSVIKRKENQQQKRIIKEALLERMKDEDFNRIIDNAIKRACETDKGFEVLRDTLGQKPVEQIEHSGEINNAYAGLTEKELRKLAGDE